MDAKRRLDEELRSVSFSAEQKRHLKKELRETVVTRDRLSDKLWQWLWNFWNGTIELPLPLGAAALGLMFIVLWKNYSRVFVIDEATALLLIEAGRASVITIKQGVSVL